jgi:hypothetical protein
MPNNRPNALFKVGDVVFLTCSRKGLNINNKCRFGTVIKRRWYKSGYRYQVNFLPRKFRPLIPVFTAVIWLSEEKIAPQNYYPAYSLSRKISTGEHKIMALKDRIKKYRRNLKKIQEEVSTRRLKLNSL